MNGARGCAYCGSEGPLTREHLFPAALHRRQKELNGQEGGLFWLSKIDREIEGEPTIKDVCAACNNGVLSSLDCHVAEMYSRHCERVLCRDDEVVFTFDYHKLKRWLLKICFNSARIHNSIDTFAFPPLLPYILGTNERVGRSVQLYVRLTYPENVPDSYLTEDAPRPYIFQPNMNRVGFEYFQVDGVGKKLMRAVNLRSFAFLLAFFEPGEKTSVLNDFAKTYLQYCPGAKMLRADSRTLRLKCSGVGAWTSFSQSRSKIVYEMQ